MEEKAEKPLFGIERWNTNRNEQKTKNGDGE